MMLLFKETSLTILNPSTEIETTFKVQDGGSFMFLPHLHDTLLKSQDWFAMNRSNA